MESNQYTEYGVELPNGQVQWGTALGHPVGTESERSIFVLILHRTALECGWLENDFIAPYKWRQRTIVPVDTIFDINNETVAPPPQPSPPPQEGGDNAQPDPSSTC